MYTSVDPTSIAAASSAMESRCPYPISRYEAELLWEFERQRVCFLSLSIFCGLIVRQLRTHIASLPSLSFEKTKFEEDEGFYATFPEARQAAINHWIAEHFPFAPWAESQVAQYQDPISISYDLSLRHCPVVPTPTVNFTTYTLADALKAPPSPRKMPAVPDAPAPPMPAVHCNYSDTFTSHDVYNRPDSILAADSVLLSKEKHSHIDQEAFLVCTSLSSSL